jgi:hypothetical protein
MGGRSLIIGLAGVIVGAGLAGGAVAIAAQDDGSSVTGVTADKAVAAAIEATGGEGKANSVERDPEDGATWEVEVTKPDGSTVDVRLDADYKVVTVEGDSEGHDPDGNEVEVEDPNDAADDAAEAAGQDQEGPDDPEQDPGEPADDD